MEEDELSGESLSLFQNLNNPAVSIVAHLAKSPIDPELDSIALEDLVECNFVGYAPIPITDWNVFEGEAPDLGEALSPMLEWVAGEDVATQPVTLVYITMQTPGNPIVMLDSQIVTPHFQMDAEGRTFARQYRLYSFDPTEA